jgi:uncharacterized membrane protein YgdD (TMEM256/DUF423 family)
MICGAALAALGVGLGAIGAHVLKDKLSAEQLVTYETGVRYQLFHAIALVLVGLIVERYAGAMLQGAGWAMLLGVLLFSGGIYAWLATGIKPFVHVVPIGGLSLIAGWVLVAVGLATGTPRVGQ